MTRRVACAVRRLGTVALLSGAMASSCCAEGHSGHEADSGTRSAGEPRNHALIIAIGEYKAGSTVYPRLLGPRNDLALLEQLLTSEQYGFAEDEITALVDDEATYAAIEGEFAKLADPENVRTGDFVYIHFSGHGGRVDDVNGDEPPDGELPGKDSTLVPHDARHNDVREILDDELSIWLARIVRRTPNVLFVADSCHSGSITRAPNSVAVRAALTEDEGDYSASAEIVDELAAARATLDAADHSFVRISAAQDRQFAVEYTPRGRRTRYGLLTWYWTKALREARPTDSYEMTFTRLQALIRKHEGGRQRPHIEGATAAVLFQGRLAEPSAELAVRDVDKPFLTFQGGLLRGVTAQSTYRRRGTGGEGEPPAVDAQITSVDVEKSEGRLLGDGDVSVGDLFEEVTHHHPFHPFRVYLWEDGPASDAMIAAVRARLGEFNGVEIVDESGSPDLIVRFFADGSGATTSALLDPAEQPYGAGTIDPRYLVKRLDTSDAAESVADNIRLIERARSLMTFTSDLLDVNDELQVELLRLDILDTTRRAGEVVREWMAGGSPDGNEHVQVKVLGAGVGQGTRVELPQGSVLAFRIRNDSDQEFFFHFANVKPNGEVALFLPKGGVDEKEARLPPGGDKVVTPLRLLEEDVGLSDRYVWLITEVPAEIWRISSSGFRGSGDPSTAPPVSAASRSLNTLLEGMTDIETRASGLDVTEPVQLAARHFQVRVLP